MAISNTQKLEEKAITLAHRIVRPSALYEFGVTNELVDFAVECAKNGKVTLADALITAAKLYLDQLIDGNEDFFLAEKEPNVAHGSYLGIAQGWKQTASCAVNGEGETYRRKGEEVYQKRVAAYLGDRFDDLMKESPN